MTLSLPKTLGRYTLFDFVGKGGMAEIYLARAKTELGPARHAVVKVILPELAERREFSEMLAAEAKLAAQLNHANCVHVLDLGREDGQLFIAMEYVEGFDLAQLLRACSKQKVKLPIEYAIHVVIEALAGLEHAHKLGIVHRDVSPSNLLLSFEGEVKVCDFGIAKANALAEGAAAPADEAIKGKAGYMSPEQARGEEASARSDVFAMGIVSWELTQGRRMYKDRLLERARAAEVPPLEPRGIPEEEGLFSIVKRALAKDPDERFPSAAAMKRELEQWAQRAKLGANAINFGAWLLENFGDEIVARRRSRERAIKALEAGPPVRAVPIADKEEPMPPSLVATAVDVAPVSSEPAPPKMPAATWIIVGLAVLAAIAFVLMNR